ncbi:MAG: hypothetical protein KKH95_01445 [Gammaproteobacteria bacterium]|nr:hypothetical protein [Gammaproteobacteria bacterium]
MSMKNLPFLAVTMLLSLCYATTALSENKRFDHSLVPSYLVALGASFDRIKNTPIVQRCLTQNPDDMVSANIELNREMRKDIAVVENADELFQFISWDFNGDDPSGYLLNDGPLYFDTTEVAADGEDYPGIIVGRFLKPVYELISKPIDALSDLNDSSLAVYSNGLAPFRDRCGDGYISRIQMGIQAGFRIKVLSVEGSSVVSKADVVRLSESLSEIMDGNITDIEKQDMLSKHKKYQLGFSISTSGLNPGPDFSVIVLSLGEFIDFVNGLYNDSYYSPIPVYTFVSDYPFETLSVESERRNYTRWLQVQSSLEKRCSRFWGMGNDWWLHRQLANNLLDNGTAIEDSCRAAFDLAKEKTAQCSDADKFALCDAPVSQACTYQGMACSEIMDGSLIPEWMPVTVYKRYAKRFRSGKTHVRKVTLCLPEDAVFDISRSDSGYHRTSNHKNYRHSHVQLSHRCSETTFRIKKKKGINFSSDIYLYGLKANPTAILDEF